MSNPRESQVHATNPLGESWTPEACDNSELRQTTSVATPGETTMETTDAGFDPQDFLKGILAPSDRSDELGLLGDYRIREVLGAGGMGVVLLAQDPALERPVAIKLMRPDVAGTAFARARFLREARAAAAVNHPRVVVVHQVGEWKGNPYLVMPLLAGQSLGRRLRNGPAIPLAVAVRIAREAADGLAAAHLRGLIHRDIKPDNIWLEETVDGTHVRLLDFGLARADEAEPLTRPGAVVGTPNYMAPEQAAGSALDARADLFSLGCVLYEMLTARRAFTGPNLMAVLSSLANDSPAEPGRVSPSVPAPLSELTMRLLEKSPERRLKSAADVSMQLGRIENEMLECPRTTALVTGSTVPATAAVENNTPPRKREFNASFQTRFSRGSTVGCSVTAVLSVLVAVGLWNTSAGPSQTFTEVSKSLPPIAMSPPADTSPPAGISPPPDNANKSNETHVTDMNKVFSQAATNTSGTGTNVALNAANVLRVNEIRVAQFARTPQGDVRNRIIGRDLYSARMGEPVQIAAILSMPAYGYLLVLRADGKEELCVPENDDVVPTRTVILRCPAVDGREPYKLPNVAGLCIVAAVVSEKPLPSFRTWRKDRFANAPIWSSQAAAPAGVVWWDDGVTIVQRKAGAAASFPRIKSEALSGPANSIRQLTDSLRITGKADAAAAFGFRVEQKD